MAIISDFQEDQDTKPSPSSTSTKRTASFSASLDLSNPLGFVEKVLDFLGEETDFLERDTAEKEIAAAVKLAKEKKRKRKAEAVAAAAAEEEKRRKEVKKEAVVKEPMEVVKEEPVEVVKEDPKEVEKAEEKKSGSRGTELFFHNPLLSSFCFALEFLYSVWVRESLEF